MESDQPIVASSPAAVYRPFDHIPNELLALILIWTSRLIDDENGKFTFPLIIPQLVSTRWKEVVLATPTLWTTLRVPMEPKLPSEVLKNYLEKSGNMPLSLNIMEFALLPIIAPHAARLERVAAFLTRESQLIDEFFSLATSLRYFSAIIFHTRGATAPFIGFELLSPSLESLHLTYVFLGQGPYPLSLNNLTELVLRMVIGHGGNVEMAGLLEMLGSMPKLKHLSLHGPRFDGREWSKQFKVVVLQDLEELVLSHCYLNCFLILTSHVRCPDLQSLGVGLLGFCGDPPPGIAWEGLSPAYPGLKHLDLWVLPSEPYVLRLAVKKLPPITTLGIRGSSNRSADGHHGPGGVADMGPWLGMLYHFRESVDTLQTRDIDLDSLGILVKDWFPRTRRIYKYCGDLDAVDAFGRVAELYPQLPEVVTWGTGEGEIEHLEEPMDVARRISRVLGIM